MPSKPVTYSEEIIEENVQYVLGMYDLYTNDNDIEHMLRQKGLDVKLAAEVLARIKKPAYEKRIRQAKRMIIAGALLFTGVFLIPYFIVKYSGFSTAGSAFGDGAVSETIFRVHFNFYKTL